jgi:hypothetical protein
LQYVALLLTLTLQFSTLQIVELVRIMRCCATTKATVASLVAAAAEALLATVCLIFALTGCLLGCDVVGLGVVVAVKQSLAVG